MSQGQLFVVGIGPGAANHLTFRAREAILASEVVIGYKTYLWLVRDLIRGKEVATSQMMEEVARAWRAVEVASEGRRVAVVSSGDPGIYGMAGLIYEVLSERDWRDDLAVEIVPGVSALNAAASLLGGPINHDFAVVSLSDLLTPWEAIARRLQAAAQADFVTVLYNPKSGRRTWQIEEARRILLEHRAPDTPVGIVTAAYRSNQRVVITDLEHMLQWEMDMLTTIIVGNSTTYFSGGRIITPRGYKRKYELGEQR